jgi:PTH1 family peptidyl-tRNA hydrolase
VIRELGTTDFTRVRLGIHPGHPLRSGVDYLLSPFKRAQLKELEQLVADGADAVVSIIAEGVEKAMTKFNRRAQGPNEEA